MRYFEQFPMGSVCPICGTGDEGECFLMPKDGTEEDGICEAIVTHRKCVSDILAPRIRYNPKMKIVYAFLPE